MPDETMRVCEGGCRRRLPKGALDRWGWCPECKADELDRYLSDQYDEARESRFTGREAWI